MTGDGLRLTHFPYCLDRQPDGTYVLLNRRYKPVGVTLTEHVDYAALPVAVRLPGLTAAVARTLSCRSDTDVQRIYLYDDSSNPEIGPRELDAYLKRLAILMKLKAA